MTTFHKYQCWKSERIGKVIVKAALDVDRATFLATHVPMSNIIYEKSPLEIPHTNEQDFLNELNRMAHEDAHVFTVLKGIPGTGKSHLIRWLYERYRQDHPNDRVLLIERANTSLKRTIQQIIESGFFETPALNEQLKQLKNASDALSRDGLADTLLNNLQVAVHEVEWEEKLYPRIAKERIDSFLLDKTIREHLKREDGPINRVVRYLQEGRGIERSEAPSFEANDFIMTPQQRGKIRQEGYREVGDVADDINRDNSKQREQLTRYLNFLLNTYAISRTTNLAASDLRDMFNDLRRTLRSQQQSLALFIEDITAFTGIDAGLIDVLITEHTGGDNKGFCRLTSVIGITDTYFSDSIPDNVRERISHQLTLSTQSGRGESDMLQDGDTLIKFVARYLNAVRMEADDLQKWERADAHQNSLPNACMTCSFRATCHAAFGAVDIASETSTQPLIVGLYPFNETSLVRLYKNLDSNVSRTPRALLDNILAYILQSHGDKVARGKFPPPAETLAPKVGLQEFDPTAHARIIEQQGQGDVERLKTLFLFWGNRNVIREGDFIGGLSSDVLTAFDILKIDGRSNNELSQPISTPKPTPEIVVHEAPINGSSVVVQPSKPVKRQSEYSEEISRWFMGGYLSSQVTNKLLQRMTDVFAGIDWQSYNVRPTKIPSANQASSLFALEGQAARQTQGQLVFSRTSELRYALEAVANFTDSEVVLEPEQYGEYLAALDAWVKHEEPRIVDFVQVRNQQNFPYEIIPKLLIQDAVLLACLSEGISALSSSVSELYQQVIAICVGQRDDHRKRLGGLEAGYPDLWKSLLGNLRKGDAAPIVFETALRQFNAPQGEAKELRFLHAGPIFQILTEFEASGWALEELPSDLSRDTGQPEWDSVIRVHKLLESQFPQAINKIFDEFKEIYERLLRYIGDSNIKSVFVEIQDILKDIASSHPIDPSLGLERQRLNANELQQLINQASTAITASTLRQKAIFLSQGYKKCVIPLQQYASFFDRFVVSMENAQKTFVENRSALKESLEASQLIVSTTAQYDTLVDQLNQVLQTQDKKHDS